VCVTAAENDVNFTKDRGSIFQARVCQNLCHRLQVRFGAAEALLTYQEARPGARSIMEKVVKEQMGRLGTSLETSESIVQRRPVG